MSDGYTILTLDELDTASHRGSTLIPVRHALGFRAAGVNAWKADTGGQLVPPHEKDSGDEELYVVLRGRARFTIDGEHLDAPAGTVVFIRDPAVKRVAVAEEEGSVVLAVGGEPGRAYDPSPWEHTFSATLTARVSSLNDSRIRQARR